MENQEKKTLVEEIRAQIQNTPSPSIKDTMLNYIERKLGEIYLLQSACLVILRDMEYKEGELTEAEQKWQMELTTVLFEIEVI